MMTVMSMTMTAMTAMIIMVEISADASYLSHMAWQECWSVSSPANELGIVTMTTTTMMMMMIMVLMSRTCPVRAEC